MRNPHLQARCKLQRDNDQHFRLPRQPLSSRSSVGSKSPAILGLQVSVSVSETASLRSKKECVLHQVNVNVRHALTCRHSVLNREIECAVGSDNVEV